jgi:hypothetical protein
MLWVKIGCLAICCLFVGANIVTIQKLRSDFLLATDGVSTPGIVVARESHVRAPSVIYFRYEFKGKAYGGQFQNDERKLFREGDRIRLVVSQSHPEIAGPSAQYFVGRAVGSFMFSLLVLGFGLVFAIAQSRALKNRWLLQ